MAFVSSTNGRAMLDSDASSPRRSAQDQLAEYGDAFGIDGTTSKAVVTQTLDSATGGSVVRADQVVDGVTVFGGQVVMSLDDDQGLVSVSSATTEATQVPAADVAEARAGQTARQRHRQEPPRHGRRTLTADARRRAPLRPGAGARDRPDGRPARLAVRGDQRLRHPRDRAGRHRPRRGRAPLQRRPGDRPPRSATTPSSSSPPSDRAARCRSVRRPRAPRGGPARS